jgi:hypothetical protein
MANQTQENEGKFWFSSVAKLALFFHDKYHAYIWPIKNKSVLVFGLGYPESKNSITTLSRWLLRFKVASVLWFLADFRMTNIGKGDE